MCSEFLETKTSPDDPDPVTHSEVPREVGSETASPGSWIRGNRTAKQLSKSSLYDPFCLFQYPFQAQSGQNGSLLPKANLQLCRRSCPSPLLREGGGPFQQVLNLFNKAPGPLRQVEEKVRRHRKSQMQESVGKQQRRQLAPAGQIAEHFSHQRWETDREVNPDPATSAGG